MEKDRISFVKSPLESHPLWNSEFMQNDDPRMSSSKIQIFYLSTPDCTGYVSPKKN